MSGRARRDLARPAGLVPDGVGGVVGARARLRDLRDRAGVGAARADRAGAERLGRRGRSRWATGLGAASSSCSYAAIAIAKSLFQKGASAASRARVPVRLDEPRVGARPRAVGADRLAVHARRVRRRDRDDRADDGAAAAVRQPPARGAGPRARAARPTPAISTTRPASSCAGASG